jgi:hypothetical protein
MAHILVSHRLEAYTSYMRLLLLASLGVGLISQAFGQWQEMPVPIVAGHPFSADEVTPRKLSPNLNSANPEASRVYRDSAGRIRIDPPTPAPPVKVSAPLLVIIDPVANVRYVLNTHTKIARRSDSNEIHPLPTTDDPWKIPSMQFIRPPGIPEPSTKSEPLGTQVIGGLTAEGRRVTSAYPKTERSVAQESVSESWYSPELQMMVLKQVHTTLLGDSVTRLENIDRSDPDRLLFQVPPEYTIEDWPPKGN